ncbi:monooxygenase [Lophiostoma macrostomum CBS 122681]|uniref:Monooxygenase n=1 Tax=Lophiostoma macrostomum CBS 122681 TaxID=1314788 RepID=A0A6A6SJR0_9PLEO|nr:monooxygenase [Lophiostoma macrostomum CBS 122681]
MALKIAIIGAGPVSLTLANILQNKSIPFTLYEATDEFRHQGGSLDLHPESGQLALEKAGLLDQFNKHARPEDDCLKLVDTSGEVLWDEDGAEKQAVAADARFHGRPEIDRAKLTTILSENLNNEAIKFCKKLTKVVPNSKTEKKYDLHFADGSVEEDFDLVVGGDGAWSKVRPLLTDVKPHYSGISSLELWCNDANNTNPWLASYVGPGMLMSMGEGLSVAAQRQGDGSIRSYASLRVPKDFWSTCGINWDDHDTARRHFVEKNLDHIGDDLKRIILESKDQLVPRTLYELPVGLTWDSRPGVTLIGDAAHLMTPFAGVGVNVGMTDSLVLAQEIVAASKGEKSLDEAIEAYEKEMFPRSTKYATKTMKNKTKHFKKDGAREFANMMRAILAGKMEAPQ